MYDAAIALLRQKLQELRCLASGLDGPTAEALLAELGRLEQTLASLPDP